MQDVEDAGVELLYKLDQQLFRRSTRGASEVTVDKGEFADDVVLVASTREAAEAVGRAYVEVTICRSACPRPSSWLLDVV